MRGRWDPVNDAIREALSAVTIADMRPRPPPVRSDISKAPVAAISPAD